MKVFWIGYIAGFFTAAIIFGIITGQVYLRNKDKESFEYVERQMEIEAIRKDYVNRDSFEFFNDIPGVRGAADNAYAEFERNRDEILQRFRDRLTD